MGILSVVSVQVVVQSAWIPATRSAPRLLAIVGQVSTISLGLRRAGRFSYGMLICGCMVSEVRRLKNSWSEIERQLGRTRLIKRRARLKRGVISVRLNIWSRTGRWPFEPRILDIQLRECCRIQRLRLGIAGQGISSSQNPPFDSSLRSCQSQCLCQSLH